MSQPTSALSCWTRAVELVAVCLSGHWPYAVPHLPVTVDHSRSSQAAVVYTLYNINVEVCLTFLVDMLCPLRHQRGLAFGVRVVEAAAERVLLCRR